MAKPRTSIPLTTTTTSSGRIKAASLKVFRGVRWLGRQGSQTPARFASVGRDIAAAWRESAQC